MSSQFTGHFATIATAYDVVLCDVWGVVHNGVAASVDVNRDVPVEARARQYQRTGGQGDRTLAAFVRMPRRLFRRVFGREWFVDSVRETPWGRS